MELVVRLHRQLRKEASGLPHHLRARSDLLDRSAGGPAFAAAPAHALAAGPGGKPVAELAADVPAQRGGAVGWLAFPFMLLFECLGPLIEVLGYVSMIVLGLAGLLSPQAFCGVPVRLGRAGRPAVGQRAGAGGAVVPSLSAPTPAAQAVPDRDLREPRLPPAHFGVATHGPGALGDRLRGRSRWGRIRRNASWQHEGDAEVLPSVRTHEPDATPALWPAKPEPQEAG